MPKSTATRRPVKPAKPYRDFPLFPHATGRWAKKIKGKHYYFGPWDDSDGALQRYLDQKDDLFAGRTPRVRGDGLTIRELLNRYLTVKRHLVDSREILSQTFAEYHRTCERIGEAFGLNRLVDDLAADDFEQLRAEMAQRWGPVRLANEIQRVRSVFKYGYEAGLLDRPVRYGPSFKKPARKVLRKERQKRGKRMFERDELRAVLRAAPATLKAMILLGINCGFGNTDVATVPLKALDLDKGWLDYPRPKTGVARRCPLWPETVEALREVILNRPTPTDEDHADLLFITVRGKTFAGEHTHRRVAGEMGKLLRTVTVVQDGEEKKIHRPGLSFYSLRHTFQTVADGARDPVVVQAIMGHAPHTNDMGAVYRERISDERLRAVVDHVRRWLFDQETVSVPITRQLGAG